MISVIAFSGKIGSGKSSISKLISESIDFQWVSFGEYVRKIATEKGIEPSRINLQDLGESLIRNNSYQFCLNVLNQAPASGKPLVVDGIRHKIALDEIKQIISPNTLFHIHLEVEDNLRKKRLSETRQLDNEEITINDSHVSESEASMSLSNIADIIIDVKSNISDTVDVILKSLP